jgi:hypothetical protein
LRACLVYVPASLYVGIPFSEKYQQCVRLLQVSSQLGG